MARYVIPFTLAGSGNNGFVIAGSQGLRVVDIELSSTAISPGADFTIASGNVLGTTTSTVTPVPLHEGDPAALSSGVNASLSGFGFRMGTWLLGSTTNSDFRLFRRHPVYVAPGGNLLFQGPTSGSVSISVYIEE